MARNKYGIYTLDLRPLGSITTDGTGIDISSILTEDAKKIIYGFNAKIVEVIFPTWTYNDGSFLLSGYGGDRIIAKANTDNGITIVENIQVDDNDNLCVLGIYITDNTLYFSVYGLN